MRKTAILLMALTLSTSAWAAFHYDISYRLNGTAGCFLPETHLNPWIQDHNLIAGGTFAVEFHPTGKLPSMQMWNNSTIGFGVTYMNLGNNKMLGNAVALHGSLAIPFYSGKHFRIGIRPSIGLAFCDKRYINTLKEGIAPYSAMYSNDTLVANVNIGSVVNAYLAAELFMDFPIKDGWEITCSGRFSHISNGSVMAPNGGYNMFNGELGLRYYPPHQTGRSQPRTNVPHRLYDGVDKPWAVEMSVSGSVRQVYYKDNIDGHKFFGVGSAKVAAYWVPLSIFRLGAGFDAFYDSYYACVSYGDGEFPGATVTYYGKTYLNTSDTKNCFRVGFSIQPEIIIGKVTVGVHVGFYLYDPVKNLEPYKDAKKAYETNTPLDRGIFYGYDFTKTSTQQDGWCYAQLVLKYHVLNHMFLQLSMKSHGPSVEFVDAGIGVAL